MRHVSWQVRTMLLIGAVGPPAASLILMTTTYLPLCAVKGESVDIPLFAAAFVLFAIPVGYVFGLVPALLAAVMYCAALTGIATPRPGLLLRACLGAISGELMGEVWFRAVIGPDLHGYGSVAALVMAVLAVARPQPVDSGSETDPMTAAASVTLFSGAFGGQGQKVTELIADRSQNVGRGWLINIPNGARQRKSADHGGEHENSTVMVMLRATRFEALAREGDEAVDPAAESRL